VKRTPLISKKHARVTVRTFAHPLLQRPLIVLGLVELLEGAELTIVLVHTITSIPTALGPNILAKAAESDATRAVADGERLERVQREAGCKRRVERVGAWCAVTGRKAETCLDRAGVTARGERGDGAVARTIVGADHHAHATLLHEGNSLIVEAIGSGWTRWRRIDRLREGYSGCASWDGQAGVLREKYQARDSHMAALSKDYRRAGATRDTDWHQVAATRLRCFRLYMDLRDRRRRW
jgi:hypothetical protein